MIAPCTVITPETVAPVLGETIDTLLVLPGDARGLLLSAVRTTPWIACVPKCVAALPVKTMAMFA